MSPSHKAFPFIVLLRHSSQVIKVTGRRREKVRKLVNTI